MTSAPADPLPNPRGATAPTTRPSRAPVSPTPTPTRSPTDLSPTGLPSRGPTQGPSTVPTPAPSKAPIVTPSPTRWPTEVPTERPTAPTQVGRRRTGHRELRQLDGHLISRGLSSVEERNRLAGVVIFRCRLALADAHPGTHPRLRLDHDPVVFGHQRHHSPGRAGV
jgi:hypothetical protein